MLLRTMRGRIRSNNISWPLVTMGVPAGVRPDGTRLKPPMEFASYAKMTNADLEAIVADLLTVPSRE